MIAVVTVTEPRSSGSRPGHRIQPSDSEVLHESTVATRDCVTVTVAAAAELEPTAGVNVRGGVTPGPARGSIIVTVTKNVGISSRRGLVTRRARIRASPA
jgi:hypothetical protein